MALSTIKEFLFMKDDRIHYVYRVIVKPTQEFYIGCRTHINPKTDKYLGSGNVIKERLGMFQHECFEKEILFEFKTRKEAEIKEAEIVTEALLRSPKCLNVVPGGYGGRYGKICSERHRIGISNSNK